MKKIALYLLFLVPSLLLQGAEAPDTSAKSVIYVGAEVLCWKAQENGLSFAIKSESTSSIADAKVENLRFKWDPGYRLGIGGYLPWDKWDVLLCGLSFHTTSLGHTQSGSDEFLFPCWSRVGPTASGGSVNSVSTRWRLHFGLLDSELGRTFFPSKELVLRPFIGTRTAWVRQKYRIVYEGGALFPEMQDDNSLKNKFFGTGPRLGLNSSWYFPHGLSLYGNAAFSLLYGSIYVHQSEEVNREEEIYQIHNIYHITKAIADLQLGIAWERGFFEDRYHFGLHFGWEQHLLFGQNQLQHFVNPSVIGAFIANQGDLTLQGLVFGARVDF